MIVRQRCQGLNLSLLRWRELVRIPFFIGPPFMRRRLAGTDDPAHLLPVSGSGSARVCTTNTTTCPIMPHRLPPFFPGSGYAIGGQGITEHQLGSLEARPWSRVLVRFFSSSQVQRSRPSM